jgi:hypothetical protein
MFGIPEGTDCVLGKIIDASQQPNGMPSCFNALSHGLKTCPRHVFFTPFRVPSRAQREIKERIPQWVSSLLFGTPEGTRLHFHSPQGMKIKVRRHSAGGGNAHPRCI